jgi:DNA adenine methylase
MSRSTAAIGVEQPTHAAPFLKSAGGKRSLLPEIREHVPASFRRYFEPFVGGGALFFDLYEAGRVHGRDGYLGDANIHWMMAYETVRDDVDDLIAALMSHTAKHSVEHYYAVREQSPTSRLAIAARAIYLNRTCFNGLHRVNRAGKFNVPIGRYANPTICDEANLRACSVALQGVELARGDFASVMAHARAGDFVYFDCPYVPVSASSSFTGYTSGGFDWTDQERLASCARRLKKQGVRVLLSNADHLSVRRLYEGFDVQRVEARRNINSKAGKRGAVGELLIW